MSEPKVFAQPDEGKVTQLDGSSRRVILSLPELMLVEFTFEKNGVGALHSHPHIQSSYVAEGVFEVTIDGVTQPGAWRQGPPSRQADRQLHPRPRGFSLSRGR